MRPQGTGRRATTLLAAAALVTALGACSNDPGLDPGPPAPAQASASREPLPTATAPIVTFAKDAQQFSNDPAIRAFHTYVGLLSAALRLPEVTPTELLAITTGEATENLNSQVQEYRDNHWTLTGASRRVVVDFVAPDATHRHVLSCQYDLAAYPVDRSGVPARAVADTWVAQEHWFVLIDGAWKVEGLYSGEHSCDNVS